MLPHEEDAETVASRDLQNLQHLAENLASVRSWDRMARLHIVNDEGSLPEWAISRAAVESEGFPLLVPSDPLTPSFQDILSLFNRATVHDLFAAEAAQQALDIASLSTTS